MANPYAVNVPNISGALMGLGQQFGQQRRDTQALDQARQDESLRMDEARRVFQSKDPDAIANLMISNPDLAERVQAAQGHKDEKTRAIRQSSLRQIAMGGDIQEIQSGFRVKEDRWDASSVEVMD